MRASAGLQQGLPRVPGCRAVTTLLWPPRELQTRARELQTRARELGAKLLLESGLTRHGRGCLLWEPESPRDPALVRGVGGGEGWVARAGPRMRRDTPADRARVSLLSVQ